MNPSKAAKYDAKAGPGLNHALKPPASDVDSLIVEVRGQKVILDSDLAALYRVPTKALNQAVKRNREKFPEDFLLVLTPSEDEQVRRQRSQSVTLKKGRGQHRKYPPQAFTEHGAIMAANVLNSPQAVRMSVFVVRAFVKLRTGVADNREMARKLAAVEAELKSRLDLHEAAIIGVLQRIMRVIDPPESPPEPPAEIGFHVKEDAPPYRVGRKRLRVKIRRKSVK